jgi:hypothetical protein
VSLSSPLSLSFPSQATPALAIIWKRGRPDELRHTRVHRDWTIPFNHRLLWVFIVLWAERWSGVGRLLSVNRVWGPFDFPFDAFIFCSGCAQRVVWWWGVAKRGGKSVLSVGTIPFSHSWTHQRYWPCFQLLISTCQRSIGQPPLLPTSLRLLPPPPIASVQLHHERR